MCRTLAAAELFFLFSFLVSELSPLFGGQIRFFERQKLERKIKQLEKKAQQSLAEGSAVPDSEKADLAQLKDDLQVRPAPLFLEQSFVPMGKSMGRNLESA